MKSLIISYLVLIGISIAVIIGCTIAGIDIFKDNTGDTSHEHSYGEWKIVEEASCTKTGLKESFCECGDKKSEEIALADHNYVSAVTDPTCTDNGYTTHTCSVCGDTYTDAETESTGHNYGSEVTAPTCTDNGYTTHTCSVCGYSYTDSEVASSGHVAGESKVVTAPTCTEGGYTTYSCEVCGESYIDDETDPVHLYTQWTITESGDTTDTYMKSCDCGQNTAIVSNAPKGSDGLAMEYSEELGGYVVTGIGTCTDTDLVIPVIYNGKPVVAIAGAEITEDGDPIWGTSFYGADISSLTIIGGVKKIGECAFAMTMSCTTLVLSDSVREIADQAFALMGVNIGGPNIHYLGTEEQWQEFEMSNHFMYYENIYISSVDYNYDFSE